MFTKGQEIHFAGEEAGYVNGYYVGPFIGKLHQFKDVKGRLCAAELTQMEAGHTKRGGAWK